MNSRLVLKWHIIVLKWCGLWPPEGGSILYNIWIVIFSLFINFGFPISQVICVLWVESVNSAVDHLIITSTVIMAVIKGFNALAKQKSFYELFDLMKELDSTVTPEEYDKIFKQKFLVSDRLLLLFCVNYMASWTSAVVQEIMSHPSKRLYSSTYYYPSEFLHDPRIYLGGVIFQLFANLLLVFVDIVVDTYGASLMLVLDGHIEVLGQRFQQLRQNESQSNKDQKKTLVVLCKKYLLIIRFGNILLFTH